jgi:membrane protease YdiL (CAAX protease family)
VAAVAFALTAPLASWLKETVFGWWPAQLAIDAGSDGRFSRTALLITAALVLLGSVVVAPVVEEHYFRGYLLQRMDLGAGLRTPLAHAGLFGAYHLWTPWLAPTRTLAVLPLAYIARRTGDLRIGIVTHVVLNSIDLLVILGALVRA